MKGAQARCRCGVISGRDGGRHRCGGRRRRQHPGGAERLRGGPARPVDHGERNVQGPYLDRRQEIDYRLSYADRR